MKDWSSPVEATFDAWVALSNAYEQSLLHMEHGDEGARAEVVRLARELEELTKSMGGGSSGERRDPD